MEPIQQISQQTPLNWFDRFINLYFNPSKTFHSLSLKPDWLTPLIVSMILMMTASILLKDIIQKEQISAARTAIMKSDKVPNDKKEQIIEQQEVMMKKFWSVGIAVFVIVLVIMFFLGGLAVWTGGNIVLGKGPSYLTVLSVFGYSGLVDVVSSLIKFPLMAYRETMRIDSGLGILVSREETRSVLYTFLSSFDLFTFWQLALLSIGVSIVYKTSVRKGALLVIILWIMWVLLKTGFAALGSISG